MCSLALCQPAPPSIHPSLHLVNLIKFLVSFLFTRRCPRTCGCCVIRACAPWRMASICGASTLCPHDQKVLKLCRSYAQHKCKMHTPRKFPGYWWLFWTQNLSRYSARLAEERRRWAILIFDRFRFATLKQLLHIAITTADWRRLYNLLYVVLDASICFPVMISLWKR